jgi:hypothetical protein
LLVFHSPKTCAISSIADHTDHFAFLNMGAGSIRSV